MSRVLICSQLCLSNVVFKRVLAFNLLFLLLIIAVLPREVHPLSVDLMRGIPYVLFLDICLPLKDFDSALQPNL